MSRTLSATLPSSTLYVSGTVNGVESTWTNATGYVWETTVQRSVDDVYRVELTLISSSGAATETSFTLYYGLHLVTNRTQADVDAGNEKAFYNASDLNRVGSAMEYIAERLHHAGHYVSISPKLDWTYDDRPTLNQMTQYLADLSTLRSQLELVETAPEVPGDMDKLTWQEANDIEQILEDVYDALLVIMAPWAYSGEFYGGEV